MKKTEEFLNWEIKHLTTVMIRLANGLLAIGTFHYLTWIVYELYKWI